MMVGFFTQPITQNANKTLNQTECTEKNAIGPGKSAQVNFPAFGKREPVFPHLAHVAKFCFQLSFGSSLTSLFLNVLFGRM